MYISSYREFAVEFYSNFIHFVNLMIEEKNEDKLVVLWKDIYKRWQNIISPPT